MPFGAALAGVLAQRGWDRSVAGAFLAMQASSLLIMTCGALWLGRLLGSWQQAFNGGFTPFVLGDVLKAAAVALLLPSLWTLKKWLGEDEAPNN
jgi:biotin transport system substrate-specific component